VCVCVCGVVVVVDEAVVSGCDGAEDEVAMPPSRPNDQPTNQPRTSNASTYFISRTAAVLTFSLSQSEAPSRSHSSCAWR
jgi:hypothetical protein